MNAANASTSPRLRRVLDVLKAHPDGLTTFEIQAWTNSCAVHSDVAELRVNGYAIERIREKNRNGRQVHRYRLRRKAA